MDGKKETLKKFLSNKKLKLRRAVFIVVYKIESGKIFYLILKRKKHWVGWEFPKGGIEKNESEIQTAIREVREETGLKIKSIKNFHKRGFYLYPKRIPDRNGIVGQTYSLFVSEVYSGKTKISKDEHSRYLWLEYSKAIKKLSKKNQRDCLTITNEIISKK